MWDRRNALLGWRKSEKAREERMGAAQPPGRRRLEADSERDVRGADADCELGAGERVPIVGDVKEGDGLGRAQCDPLTRKDETGRWWGTKKGRAAARCRWAWSKPARATQKWRRK